MSAQSTDPTDFEPAFQVSSAERAGSVTGRLYRSVLKRALDVAFVLIALPLWLPLILVSALVVARDGHNPFYAQERVGRNGRIFRMWKLRSMVPDADARLTEHLANDPAAQDEWDSTQKLKDDPRITSFGRVLRKSSMDELPQLFNVLAGEMSLVGPRPMMVSQRDLYHGTSYYALRPGLTGFWQISNRNLCRFCDRVRFDNAYERSVSLRTDIAVLLRTVVVVLRGTGY